MVLQGSWVSSLLSLSGLIFSFTRPFSFPRIHQCSLAAFKEVFHSHRYWCQGTDLPTIQIFPIPHGGFFCCCLGFGESLFWVPVLLGLGRMSLLLPAVALLVEECAAPHQLPGCSVLSHVMYRALHMRHWESLPLIQRDLSVIPCYDLCSLMLRRGLPGRIPRKGFGSQRTQDSRGWVFQWDGARTERQEREISEGRDWTHFATTY